MYKYISRILYDSRPWWEINAFENAFGGLRRAVSNTEYLYSLDITNRALVSCSFLFVARIENIAICKCEKEVQSMSCKLVYLRQNLQLNVLQLTYFFFVLTSEHLKICVNL